VPFYLDPKKKENEFATIVPTPRVRLLTTSFLVDASTPQLMEDTARRVAPACPCG